jgi:hypothetical protein
MGEGRMNNKKISRDRARITVSARPKKQASQVAEQLAN